MKKGYGGVFGYIEKCVGFVGMLFDVIIYLKSRE